MIRNRMAVMRVTGVSCVGSPTSEILHPQRRQSFTSSGEIFDLSDQIASFSACSAGQCCSSSAPRRHQFHGPAHQLDRIGRGGFEVRDDLLEQHERIGLRRFGFTGLVGTGGMGRQQS